VGLSRVGCAGLRTGGRARSRIPHHHDSRALAEHCRARGAVFAATKWVPQYGREHAELKLDHLRASDPDASVFDIRWEAEDFAVVAERQNADEDTAAGRGGPLLFCDTDSFAIRVWEERYVGVTSEAVIAESDRQPALNLLTDDEAVPFVDDGMRDGEDIGPWMTGRFAASRVHRAAVAAADGQARGAPAYRRRASG
jgi:hypothetical protein